MRVALRVTDAVSCANMWRYMANTTPGGSPIQWEASSVQAKRRRVGEGTSLCNAPPNAPPCPNRLLNVESKCHNVVDHVVAELDERVSWQRFGECISDHVLGIAGDECESVPVLILQETQASCVMPGTIE